MSVFFRKLASLENEIVLQAQLQIQFREKNKFVNKETASFSCTLDRTVAQMGFELETLDSEVKVLSDKEPLHRCWAKAIAEVLNTGKLQESSRADQ